MGNVRGIAEFEEYVWFTDWTARVIRRAPKRVSAPRDDVRVSGGFYRPTALQIVHPYRQPSRGDWYCWVCEMGVMGWKEEGAL